MRKVISFLCLFLFIICLSNAFAEHNGYIVAVKKDKLAAAIAYGVYGNEESCVENDCIVTVDSEELAKKLVRDGIGVYYEKNLTYSAIPPEPEPLPAPAPAYDPFSIFSASVGYCPLSNPYPNDTLFCDYLRADDQWYLQNDTINWLGAYNTMLTINRTAKVAVLDSGLVSNHEDLSYNKISCYTHNLTSTTCVDGTGHGTAITGIIGAETNNGKGVASTSYGKASVINVNLPMVSGGFNGNDIYTALGRLYTLYTNYNDINDLVAVNLSNGSYIYSQTYCDRIKSLGDKGIVVVNSAGNDNRSMAQYPHYPTSCYTNNNVLNNIIGVIAIDYNLNKSKFSGDNGSNYGGHADIAAPGNSMVTVSNNGGYNYPSWGSANTAGTSFAAPFITGVLAAGKATGPNVTPQQLVQMLYWSATRMDNLKTYVRNGKVVNVASFLSAVKECQANLNVCNTRFPKNTFPQRYNMASLPNPDPDKAPTNWFAPTQAKATINSANNRVTFTWDHPEHLADHYSLSWREGSNGNWQTAIVGADTREFTLYNRSYGSYEFQVKSVKNGVASSAASTYRTFYPESPQNITFTSGGNGSITLTWSHPQNIPDAYKINWFQEDLGIYGDEITLSAGSTSYTYSDLPDGVYKFVVSSVKNGIYIGYDSSAPEVALIGSIVSTEILRYDFGTTGGGTGSNILVPNGYFTAMYYINGGGIVYISTSGRIYIQAEDDNLGESFPVQGGETIEVECISAGDINAIIYLIKDPNYVEPPLTSPTNFNVTLAGKNTLKLTWTPPENLPSAYKLHWNNEITATQSYAITLPAGSTSYIYDNLPDGVYTFTLTSVRNGIYSSPVSTPEIALAGSLMSSEILRYDFTFTGNDDSVDLSVPNGYGAALYYINGPADGFVRISASNGFYIESWSSSEGSFPTQGGETINMAFEGHMGRIDVSIYLIKGPTHPAGSLVPPDNFNVTSAGMNALTLTWMPPQSMPDEYRLEWYRETDNTHSKITLPAYLTSHTYNYLPDGIYTFTIYSVRNGVLSSPASMPQVALAGSVISTEILQYDFTFTNGSSDEIFAPYGYNTALYFITGTGANTLHIFTSSGFYAESGYDNTQSFPVQMGETIHMECYGDMGMLYVTIYFLKD